MPDDILPYAHINAVLARGAIAALRFPRSCADRRCRRHGRCGHIAPRDPRCIALLKPADFKRLCDLMQTVADILQGRLAARPPGDPDRRDVADDVFDVLARCFADMPWYRERIVAWCGRYSGHPELAIPEPRSPPPPPPAPPIDTAALLREMKAELARDGIVLDHDD